MLRDNPIKGVEVRHHRVTDRVRRGGLRVYERIELYGFKPCLGTLCCVHAQDVHLSLTVPLSTLTYKWALDAGGNPAMD